MAARLIARSTMRHKRTDFRIVRKSRSVRAALSISNLFFRRNKDCTHTFCKYMFRMYKQRMYNLNYRKTPCDFGLSQPFLILLSYSFLFMNLYDKGWLMVNGNRYNILGMRYTILG